MYNQELFVVIASWVEPDVHLEASSQFRVQDLGFRF